MTNIPSEIKEKVDLLNKATVAYDAGNPIIEDVEWDKIYFEVQKWENDNNTYVENSPTHHIHFETVSKLNKVELNHPMMSLAKTKSLEEVKKFCGDKDCIAMPKMDGLSCTLHYEGGKLVKAATRGNGLVGEDITHNALVVKNIPHRIETKDPFDVDGEIICTYKDFEPFSKDYKNPRNFAAGSIRLLNSEESYNRHLTFVAWDCHWSLRVFDDEVINQNEEWLMGDLDNLKFNGFASVPYCCIPDHSVEYAIDYLKQEAKNLSYPIDGIVFKYNDGIYYDSLGATAHHPNGAIAFKFADDLYETTLRDIEWSMGRTGVLTPIAVFDEVDTGDSLVTRANLHNISIMEEMGLDHWYNGFKINVYMSNMIIPQVKEVLPEQLEGPHFPFYTIKCPCCGSATEIRQINDSKELICANPDCPGKLVNKLNHFCGKKGLDIKGISKATLQKLIELGWVSSFSDIYKLDALYADRWRDLEGFGSRSVNNILAAIEFSRKAKLSNFISAIGIPLIGMTVAKDLAERVKTYENLRKMVDEKYDFAQWPGFAEAKRDSLLNFDYSEADKVYKELSIVEEEKEASNTDLAGKTFTITGTVNNFSNRDELKSLIEAHGGKVTNSISSRTSYLINNDIDSTSSKNKSAKERGIPIITEEDFLKMI